MPLTSATEDSWDHMKPMSTMENGLEVAVVNGGNPNSVGEYKKTNKMKGRLVIRNESFPQR